MTPKRPTRPTQLERRTLRTLSAADLAPIAATVCGGRADTDTKWICPTEWLR